MHALEWLAEITNFYGTSKANFLLKYFEVKNGMRVRALKNA